MNLFITYVHTVVGRQIYDHHIVYVVRIHDSLLVFLLAGMMTCRRQTDGIMKYNLLHYATTLLLQYLFIIVHK